MRSEQITLTKRGRLELSGFSAESPRLLTRRHSREVLAAMSLVAGSLLVLEITTTRVLSVAMAYHFAVLSISLAMLGLAVGGVVVHLYSEFLTRHDPLRVASWTAVLFGVTTAGAFLALIGLPIQADASVAGTMNLMLLFLPQAVPYLFAGVTISVLLATFPRSVSRIYAADLAGAATGCIATAIALPRLGGPGAILTAAATAVAAGWILQRRAERPSPPALRASRWLVVTVGIAVLASLTGSFELRYVKGELEVAIERVVWSSHSRLAVTHELFSRFPTGWGFGANYRPAERLFNFRRIRIDGLAQTPILAGGDDASFRHLTWDVTSLPYLLKVGGRAMIIGSGGGRDIITAKTSGDWRVDAVEINEGIVRLMLTEYADFSGQAYRQPGTTIRTVDGRTAIEQAAAGFYDLIQMSAVDTWAAGSSGSLALMENGLYTVEAFTAALAALKPDGYFSISRFRYPDDFYGETVRMVAIAIEALALQGIESPSDNVALISNVPSPADWVIATMLVKPTPFTNAELARLSDICSNRGFGLVWPPSDRSDPDNPAAALLRQPGAKERDHFYRTYPIDVRPTWDDRPYFFHQARLSSKARIDRNLNPGAALRLAPMVTLTRLTIFLLVASIGLVASPLILQSPDQLRRVDIGALGYFSSLGLGFMFYEIPLVQKLTLGLGHPTHALTVVLFGLLIGTATGSRFSGMVPDRACAAVHITTAAAAAGIGLLLVRWAGEISAVLFMLTGPAKVGVAGLLVFGAGVVLGTLFPFGVRLLSRDNLEWSVAWCWAANGAAGVLASVCAMIIGIELGMSATLTCGAAVYAIALAIVVIRYRRPAPRA
jgi:hypothetical protein